MESKCFEKASKGLEEPHFYFSLSNSGCFTSLTSKRGVVSYMMRSCYCTTMHIMQSSCLCSFLAFKPWLWAMGMRAIHSRRTREGVGLMIGLIINTVRMCKMWLGFLGFFSWKKRIKSNDYNFLYLLPSIHLFLNQLSRTYFLGRNPNNSIHHRKVIRLNVLWEILNVLLANCLSFL